MRTLRTALAIIVLAAFVSSLSPCSWARAADSRDRERPAAPPPAPPDKPAEKPELEYVMNTDEHMSWTVVDATPLGMGRNSVRTKTDPPFGLPGDHTRLAVFRKEELVGFLRLLQSQMGGGLLGQIGLSMDPADLEAGDILHQFQVTAREKTPDKELTPRQKRGVSKAIANLGARSYETREEATTLLQSFGREILPRLEQAVASPDPEIKTRARDIRRHIVNRERPVKPKLATVLMRRSGVHKPTDERGFLGISMSDAEGEQHGAQVVAIVKDTPAEEVGLQIGDILTAIDSDALHDSTDLLEVVSARPPGATIKITLLREDKELVLETTLISRPLQTEMLRR